MAKGDIFSSSLATGGVFQPAAGVEIILTSHGGISSILNWWDGGTAHALSAQPDVVAAPYRLCHPLNNGNAWLKLTGSNGSFSGVQVK